MDFNTGYNFDNDDESKLTAITFNPDDNMAQQQFKDEVDINTIVARFGLTGRMPENFQMPQYADVSNIPNSFHAALQYVEETQREFMRAPAELRARFNNDPQQLLNFVYDDKNHDEARKLGLLREPPETTRDTLTPPAGAGATQEQPK